VERFFWICLGGAAGTGARYLVSGWTLRAFGTAFPYGTLSVNLIGSLLLGLVMYLGLETSSLTPTLRLTLATGVMGGFTTYSTFSYETMRSLQDGAWAAALLNVLVTVVGCLLACFLGWSAGRWMAGT
jgi:fluoride exporter